MASPSSTTSDDKISKLVNEGAKLRRNREDRQLSNPKAKIQKVQTYLGVRREFARYYSPKLVSIGPIHRERGENYDRDLGENYKLMWAAMYLEVQGKGTREAAAEILGKIKMKMDKLKECYSDDVIRGVADDELAQIFLLDGCAVLHFMEKASVEQPEELKIKVDQMVIVHHDLLLLENQLPYQLLKLLCNDDEAKLEGYINNFFKMHHMMQPDSVKLTIRKKATEGGGKEAIITVDHPTHLLDFLRTAILRKQTEGKGKQIGKRRFRDWTTYRNIQELQSAGIEVIKNEQHNLTDVNFTRHHFFAGKLRLSELIVDDFTATSFLNLIAYEMCSDFENHYEISSYVAFLDSLIDHPDDVKVLRKAGVLRNALGSDEEVAKLFNTIAIDLVPNADTYAEVRQEIERHYKKKFFTWIAEGLTNHFHSPWSIAAFLAAFLALALTFIQTWVAVSPLHRTA